MIVTATLLNYCTRRPAFILAELWHQIWTWWTTLCRYSIGKGLPVAHFQSEWAEAEIDDWWASGQSVIAEAINSSVVMTFEIVSILAVDILNINLFLFQAAHFYRNQPNFLSYSENRVGPIFVQTWYITLYNI